jgi:hypothetical protein
MNEIYEVVHQLVKDGHLNNKIGFSGRDVLTKINQNNIHHNFQIQSISCSLWKHAEGGGNTPVVYYKKMKRAKYKIKPAYL